MTALFEPCRIGPVSLRNAIVMSPMSQNSAGQDGCATDWHMVHYGSRAVGGCGLVLFEDTAVLENGRVSSASLGLYADTHVAPLARIVAFCKANGAQCGIQIAHAGRKAFRDLKGSGCDLISVKEAAFDAGWTSPRSASDADLRMVIAGFAEAARRAHAAGFALVEIHAAHGYLLHQFLSPVLNDRDDEWGGDVRGRENLLFRVLAAVREMVGGQMAIVVRLPAEDGLPGGLDAEAIRDLSFRLIAAGADGVDLAGGSLTRQAIPVTPEAQHALAAQLRRSGLTVLCGGARDGEDAARLRDSNTASHIVFGRPLLRHPYWPLQVAQDLGVEPPLPPQYKLAF